MRRLSWIRIAFPAGGLSAHDGVASGGDSDAGSRSAGLASTSFYACSCATGDPSGALAIALAALAAAAPRRRRR